MADCEKNWRSGRDSNPRDPFGSAHLANECLQPLGHRSGGFGIRPQAARVNVSRAALAVNQPKTTQVNGLFARTRRPAPLYPWRGRSSAALQRKRRARAPQPGAHASGRASAQGLGNP